jgi:hypothetical protein
MAQTGRVLSFLRVQRSSDDWTQQELAEFYRVESALLQHGLLVVTDRGLSDEGDPWFVFCRSETEEVLAHFARIDGHYLVVSSAFSGVARGRDFKLLVRELMEAHPLMLPRNHGDGQKVFVHPAALLAALLAASYLVSSDKDAAVQEVSAAGHEKATAFWSHFANDFAILSAVAIAATWIEHRVESAFDLGQDITMAQDAGQGANPPADLASHAVDAAFFDTAAHDDRTALHGVAADPARATALEPKSDANEVSLLTPSTTLLKGPIQSAVASAPDTNLVTAFNVDGVAASHADNTKAGYGVALNDADQPAQVLVAPETAIGARQPLGSSAIPTDALRVATNDSVGFNHENQSPPANVSTLSQSSSDMQSIVTPTLSTSSVVVSTNASAQVSTNASAQVFTNASAQVSTDASAQVSTSASAQGVASTSTPLSPGVPPTTFAAQTSDALLQFSVNLKLAEALVTMELTHGILGIMPHADAHHI